MAHFEKPKRIFYLALNSIILGFICLRTPPVDGFLTLTVAPVLLILREPDLGTSLVFVPVFFLMLFTAGARWRDLGYVAVVALVMLPLLQKYPGSSLPPVHSVMD